ncbi:MAG: carboxymuconolactone decarboxylase family protein [Alphaproteobacteria bacterium]|nr:carboxymuconolactone decarboxylase family protein [Alphaproteobacteria bacterium]
MAQDIDWPEFIKTLNRRGMKLREGNPDVMAAFRALDQAASKDGALDSKTKELMCMAIGIAIRCDGCLAYHAKAAIKYGATREEVLDMIGVAVYMGGGPSNIYGAEALDAFDSLLAAS